jgi:tRNA(Ile2) C34 agmatinyltransferase TiaS
MNKIFAIPIAFLVTIGVLSAAVTGAIVYQRSNRPRCPTDRTLLRKKGEQKFYCDECKTNYRLTA